MVVSAGVVSSAPKMLSKPAMLSLAGNGDLLLARLPQQPESHEVVEGNHGSRRGEHDALESLRAARHRWLPAGDLEDAASSGAVPA